MEANIGKTRAQPLAWLVHFYTASGAVLAFGAALAAIDGRFRDAFLFLIASTAVDATDGMFARRAGLPAATPRFDGARLDDIVDYLTFVFVPMVILYLAGDLPAGWGFWVVTGVLLITWLTLSRLQLNGQDVWPAEWAAFRSPLHQMTAGVIGTVFILVMGLSLAALRPRREGRV